MAKKKDKSKEDMDVYISTKDAASILKVSAQTIRRMIERGDIRAIEVHFGERKFFAIRRGDVENVETNPPGRPTSS